MLLIALAAPLLLGPAAPGAGMFWASSAGIARLEAKRQGRPVLAVYMPGGRGFWLANALSDPEVQQAASGFVVVGVESAQEFGMLVPKTPAPPFSQMVFLGSDGKILKRLSGFLRPRDLRDAIDDVWRSVGERPPLPNPDAQARWAAIQAMRGNVDAAQRLLAGPARTARAGARADVYGAIGDELRARGLTEAAMRPLERAVALCGPTAQSLRWRVRLAMNRARLGERQQAVKDLFACTALPGISNEDRNSVNALLDRMTLPPMPRAFVGGRG